MFVRHRITTLRVMPFSSYVWCGCVRTFVRAYDRASKRVYVVHRHHVLKCMAYDNCQLYIIVCLSNVFFLQTAPTKPTESTVKKPADIARISRRARSRTDVAPMDVKPGSSQTRVRL